jgi:FkbM family methyltransferase
MKWFSRLRLVKYALKSRILARSPASYWKLRALLRTRSESELALVGLLARRDAISIDVGAHFGLYTFRMFQHSREVHAFEPVTRLARVLARGFRNESRVVVHQGALSSEDGETTLRAPSAGLGRSTVETRNALAGLKDPTGPIQSSLVKTWALDSFQFDDVALIKIDVEGHEERVLSGAASTLERCRPAIIVELEDRHNPGCKERISRSLEGLGYECFQLDGATLVKNGKPGHHNFLFLQPSQAALIQGA